jgi:trigger factor
VIGDIKVEVPNAMIETEVNRSLHEFEKQLSQSGVNLEKYAQMTGKTKDQLKDEIKPDAEKRVKADLALIQIAKKEKIEITDEDIEKLLTKWDMPDVKNRSDLDASKQLDTDKVLEVIKKEKTYEFLVSKAKVS